MFEDYDDNGEPICDEGYTTRRLTLGALAASMTSYRMEGE